MNTNPFCSAHVLCKTTPGKFASSAGSPSLNSVLQEQPVGSATPGSHGRCCFYYPQTSYLTVKSQTGLSDSKTIGGKRVSNAPFILLQLEPRVTQLCKSGKFQPSGTIMEHSPKFQKSLAPPSLLIPLPLFLTVFSLKCINI